MDPTYTKCLVIDSFSNQQSNLPNYSLQPIKIKSYIQHLSSNVQTARLDAKNNLPPKYVDVQLYNKLSELKDKYGDFKQKVGERQFNTIFKEARDIFNPFEKLGRSALPRNHNGQITSQIPVKRYGHAFFNRAAIKLANIDAVFKLTGPTISYLQPIDFKADRDQAVDGNQYFTYADLAEGPGAMAQYMKYRWPLGRGFGITLRDPSSETLKWEKILLQNCSKNRGTFTALYGAKKYGGDETGDLYINAEPFAKEVLNIVDGIDCVTGDGGIDVDTADDFPRQEYLNSRLVLAQIYAGLLIIRKGSSGQPSTSHPSHQEKHVTGKGGDLCLKIFDSVTEVTAQMLFLVACCFEEFHLFKPVASRPANAERYIIAKGCKTNIQGIIDLLAAAYNQYTDSEMVFNIFNTETLKGDEKNAWNEFQKWLTKINNQHISQQFETNKKIIAYLENLDYPEELEKIKEDQPKVNLGKALQLWNLPDNNHFIR